MNELETTAVMQSTPKGIFEALINGTWPTEAELDLAEQQAASRLQDRYEP